MATDPKQVKSIFLAAADKGPEERAAFLDAACGGDEELRHRAEELLRVHDEPGGLPGVPHDTTQTQGDRAPDAIDLSFLAASAQPGSLGRLGHYEVLEIVGKGGMGIVLKAFDEKLHRVVAIKVMAPQLAADATSRKRFVREAQAAAAVRNEHVIDIHAVEDAGSLPYLVMEYISGISLQERLDRSGPLHLPEILRIGMQMASGLAAAHAQGLIHRDIKPANILLENSVERVKITDFGLARAVDDASLTKSGMVVGTPQYMAPEQAEGETVDHRADLFSLGSVLYAMCTGRPPFRGSTTMAVLKRVCEDTPRPIRESNPEIPDWLAAIIGKLHGKKPEDRFQSAAEVTAILGQRLAELQQPPAGPLASQDRPARQEPRPDRWTWFMAAGVLLLLSIGALALTEVTGVTQIVPAVIRAWTGADRSQAGNAGPEGDRPTGIPAPEPAARPFVIVARADNAAKDFATLAEAVTAATDGDTIEIRGNGPFISQPISITGVALTIRAGDGFRPVIKFDAQGDQDDSQLLKASAALILEGLEFHDNGRDVKTLTAPRDYPSIVASRWGSLHVANCRFLLKARSAITQSRSQSCQIRNCEVFAAGPHSLNCVLDNGTQFGIDNNVIVILGNGSPTVFGCGRVEEASIRLTHNLILGGPGLQFAGTATATTPVRVELSANIHDHTSAGIHFYWEEADGIQPGDAKTILRRLFRWQEEHGVWSLQGNKPMVGLVRGRRSNGESYTVAQVETLAAWKQLLDQPDGAVVEGLVRYALGHGGDVRRKVIEVPKTVTPNDFRLAADSAGYRAGKDGKDLGPDIDLVGPGAAYERWKKTPEYQEWLKTTGQVKR